MSDLKASVVIDLKGNLPEQSKRFQKHIESMSAGGAQKLAIMGRSIATLSNQIDRFGNRAALGAGVVGIAFKRSFIDTAAEFERFSIQLEQLEGSSEAGKKAMAWVSDFAVRTPLELNEVTAAYAQLRTVGIDPTNGSLQALVDANAKMAGSSQDLQSIILALGQAWTAQKFQGQDIMQLTQKNIPVWDLLSKATGKSVQQLQKLSGAGKLGRKEIQLLIDAIGKEAAGSADKFAQTWEGKISNLNDQWSRWKLQVMASGTFDFMKGEIDNLLGQINKLNQDGTLSVSAKETSDNIVKGLKAAKEIGTGLWTVMKQIGTAAKFVADQVGGFENLAKALAYLYIGNKALRIGASVGGGITQAAGALLGNKGVAGKVAGALSSAGATPVFVTNWPGGTPGVGDIAGALGKGGALPSSAKTITSTWRLLKNLNPAQIAALGGGAAAASAAYVGAAGLTGYGAGRLGMNVYEKFAPESYARFSDAVGGTIATILAKYGNKEAQKALDVNLNPQTIRLEITGAAARHVRVADNKSNVDVISSGRVMPNY